MLNEFIKDLQNSPYYNRLFAGQDVILISMYGSRPLDIVDSKSDYDLVVITNDFEEPVSPEEFLTYNGIKVHWYYKPISGIIDARRKTHSYFGAIQFAFISDDIILYENPAYARVIRFLKNRKDTIGRINAYNLINAKQEIIDSVLSEGTITEHNYTKFLYHLCYTSYYLYGEAPNKEFLREIKRIGDLPVRAEFIGLAVTRLAMLRNYSVSNPFDVDGAVAMLDNEVQLALQNE